MNTKDTTLPQERAANVTSSATLVPEVEVKFEPDVCVCLIKSHSGNETSFAPTH